MCHMGHWTIPEVPKRVMMRAALNELVCNFLISCCMVSSYLSQGRGMHAVLHAWWRCTRDNEGVVIFLSGGECNIMMLHAWHLLCSAELLCMLSVVVLCSTTWK